MNLNELMNVIHLNNSMSVYKNHEEPSDFTIKDIIMCSIISICILVILVFLCLAHNNINNSEVNKIDIYSYHVTDEILNVVDTIEYENLVPGKTYTVTSQITLSNGTTVEKEVEFTPTTSDGIVNVHY
ncbi:MAG: VaFE repeat-containing surface-anchored protein [Bacilli bacterium]|nr:VaFE repeat-containing surface-anchored protein [Bacilli bacterium]